MKVIVSQTAVHEHVYGGARTSGVSTSTDLDVALGYRGTHIAVINGDILSSYSVEEIAGKADDKEIILFSLLGQQLPREIIIGIIPKHELTIDKKVSGNYN